MIGSLGAPAPAEFGQWMISAAALLVIVATVINIVKSFRRSPPIEAEFVTRVQCDKLHDQGRSLQAQTASEMNTRLTTLEVGLRSEMRIMTEKLQDSMSGLNLTNERRAGDLHERINTLSDRVSKLEGKVE